MNKKAKKGLIISLSVIIGIFLILLALPFAFKGKITELAKNEINNMLRAKVDFGNFNMSFIKNFPNASFSINDLQITGTEAFENDTLFFSEKIDVAINLKSLFSGGGYEIRKLAFGKSGVFLHVLPDGSVNWDIMREEIAEQEADTSKMSFNFKLNNVDIKHADFVYQDDEGGMKFEILGLALKSSGDLSADSSLLRTHVQANAVSFWMDGVEYLSKATAEIKADVNANLNDFVFTFSENSSRINAIAFSFAGWFQLLDPEGFDMDITLNTSAVDFKSILSLVPAVYATEFESLKADGKVALSGYVKGKMAGDDYPAFDLKLAVEDAWFQYPALPKSLQNIHIGVQVRNPGGDLDLTILDIPKFSFVMGGNPFSASARVTFPLSDPDLTLNAKGKLDLGMVKEIYPLGDDMDLNGVFNLDLALGGRMSYYEKNQFDKFTFGGNMSVSGLLLKMASLPQEVAVPKANLTFNNRYVDLSVLQLQIGKNDLQATGKLENFVAYALKDQNLNGQLNLTSNYLNISDFMSGETEEESPGTEEKAFSLIEVPKNINFAVQASCKELLYGKMRFTNANGRLKVENGEVKFENMNMQAFGGNLGLNGTYSAADLKKPFVDMNFSINEVVFTEILEQVETLQKIVPIFSKASGKFSTKMSFHSLLKQDMTPDLESILAKGSFSTKSVGLAEVPALNALASGLKKPELSSLSLKDLSLLFAIKDGRIATQPFDVKAGNVKMNVSGSTGLDKTLSYSGKAQLPNDLNLGKFSTVGFTIGGTFTNPSVKLDWAETLNTLADEAKSNVKAEIDKKVDEVKAKADAEIQKQKEAAAGEIKQQADKLRSEAKAAGDKLVQEAQKQSEQLASKVTNPIAKKAAELSGAKLVDEARKKADELYRKADAEATKLEEKANQ
ncbi:MAG: AsmA family protein [Prevotellaceae bacterium]|jgi:hypothetical protein|nr:AsmA family protein [Prevotellaceae bacterium]